MPKTSYVLFQTFLERFKNQGYLDIDRNDSFIQDLEAILDQNNQFIYLVDLMELKVRYASSNSRKMFGLEPDEITQGTFFSRCHSDFQSRHSLARAKTIQFAQGLFIRKSGSLIHSSNFKLKNARGKYFNSLHQAKMFYSKEPMENVFILLVITDLAKLKVAKHGFHYYIGADESMFRYPDEELLKIGHDLSNRELEIIQLIAQGFDSEHIAMKLFLSLHTVNTHRRNILRKTGFHSTLEFVIELQSEGLV